MLPDVERDFLRFPVAVIRGARLRDPPLQALAAARAPLSVESLSERSSGKCPWKKRLPQLVETPVSLGRARRVEGGVLSVD